jgi:tetratricopeptide (TPR) repeat protein
MRLKMRMLVLLLAATAAACATSGGGASSSSTAGKRSRFMQADYKVPEPKQIEEESQRGYMNEAQVHVDRARAAQAAGNMDQARAEYAAAADSYANFMDKFPSELYRMPVRMRAADMYMFGQQPQKAAEQAQKIYLDPEATPQSKAIASKVAADAWLGVANAKVRAGQLDPIRLSNADQRRGQPLQPRVPPGEWKSFVDATDRLREVLAQPGVPPPDAKRPGPAISQLDLIAAEVEYAFDNMEDAQKRFANLIQKYPEDADALGDAVPLYLQTFLHLGDEAGYQAAVVRLRTQIEAASKAATDPKAQAAFAKVQEALGRATAGVQFAEAQKLLDQGKPGEAAEAFEKLAADPRGGDVPNALHNAAVAWDKANQPDKASALRKRIVEEFGDSRVAPNNLLLLAVADSKKKQHLEAGKLYEQFLAKYPDNPNRCVALQNVASELDLGKKPTDAADKYLAFGKDAACAKENPNTTALALYRAGRLYETAKKRPQAKEAYAAAVALQGVTDAVAKSQVEDARRRLKGQ